MFKSSSFGITILTKTCMILLLVKFEVETAGVRDKLTTNLHSVATSTTVPTVVTSPSQRHLEQDNNGTHSGASISRSGFDISNFTRESEAEHFKNFTVTRTTVDSESEPHGGFAVLTQLVIHLAQCRANCLDKFGGGESPESLEVLLKSQPASPVSTCWNTCQLLEEGDRVDDRRNSTPQNITICSSQESGACLIGCQEACEFHLHQPENTEHDASNSQMLPPIALPVEPLLKIFKNLNPPLLKWPNASTANAGHHVVYSLIRYDHSSWIPVGEQTILNQMSVDLDSSKADQTSKVVDLRSGVTDLRVLAVNAQGLTHVYSTAGGNFETRRGRQQEEDDPWHFRLSSLVHQKFLVVTEVRWEFPRELQNFQTYGGERRNDTLEQHRDRSTNATEDLRSHDDKDDDMRRHTLFLLTWEVYGGLVRGHLVTETNVVTISLWPETSYSLQVGLIDDTEVKVEKGKAIMTQLEGILSTGGELPVRSESQILKVNTTDAPYPVIVKKSGGHEVKKTGGQEFKKSVGQEQRKRSADELSVLRHDATNDTKRLQFGGSTGKYLGETRSTGSGGSHFCSWNSQAHHQHQHTSGPSEDEVRACMLIWTILIVCLLLIFMMFLYFSVTVYLAMKKQIYFQKLHRTCSVSSIYSRQFYRLHKSIFRKNHYPTNQHKPPFTSSSSLELLPLTDSSNSSASEAEDVEFE